MDTRYERLAIHTSLPRHQILSERGSAPLLQTGKLLLSLGRDEAQAAAEQTGQAEIRCGFCGRNYRFPLAEIGVLFEQPAANSPSPDRLQ